MASRLLALPLELRRQIYNEYFKSLTIPISIRAPYLPDWVPDGNYLALLETCGQINDEVGDSWLGQVTFNFFDPVADLGGPRVDDTISRKPRYELPPSHFCPDDEDRGKIRHMRLTIKSRCKDEYPDPLTLSSFYGTYDSTFDTVIIDDLRDFTCYRASNELEDHRSFCAPFCDPPLDRVDWLVRSGGEFKELRYIYRNQPTSPCGKCFKRHGDHRPSEWLQALLARDGAKSKASVTVLQAPRHGVSVEDESIVIFPCPAEEANEGDAAIHEGDEDVHEGDMDANEGDEDVQEDDMDANGGDEDEEAGVSGNDSGTWQYLMAKHSNVMNSQTTPETMIVIKRGEGSNCWDPVLGPSVGASEMSREPEDDEDFC